VVEVGEALLERLQVLAPFPGVLLGEVARLGQRGVEALADRPDDRLLLGVGLRLDCLVGRFAARALRSVPSVSTGPSSPCSRIL
jgi:hypothetical protein